MHFRCVVVGGLIGYFAGGGRGGPQEKFYRIFTAMIIKVAYDPCSCIKFEEQLYAIVSQQAYDVEMMPD